jgi:hypothetical protein
MRVESIISENFLLKETDNLSPLESLALIELKPTKYILKSSM